MKQKDKKVIKRIALLLLTSILVVTVFGCLAPWLVYSQSDAAVILGIAAGIAFFFAGISYTAINFSTFKKRKK